MCLGPIKMMTHLHSVVCVSSSLCVNGPNPNPTGCPHGAVALPEVSLRAAHAHCVLGNQVAPTVFHGG